MFRKVAREKKTEVLHKVVNCWTVFPSLKYLKVADHGEVSYGWIGAGPVVKIPDTRTQYQNIEHSH